MKFCVGLNVLTYWGRVTHICVSKLTIIGSDNGLSPGRRQAIIWTNAGILLIQTLGTNFSEILGEIHSFSFSKIHLKMSSAKWRLFGLGLNELSVRMHFGFICCIFTLCCFLFSEQWALGLTVCSKNDRVSNIFHWDVEGQHTALHG